jgi:hypothetical protein
MTTSNAYNTGKIFDGYMGRNVIINGNCSVAQRASLVASTGISGYGGPDRFNAANNGSAGGQFTQSQGTITFGGVTKNAVVQTVNTAITSQTTTNYWGGIRQVIEGLNCYHLLGQPITASFIFNTNVSGTYAVSIQDSSTNSYVTTFTATANTPQKVIITIPPLGTGFNIPNSTAAGMIIWIGALNNGTFSTAGLNLWQTGNFITAGGSITNWGASINNFIAVTELQLEEGAIATSFERENFQNTLNKCYRYFVSDTIGFIGAGWTASAYVGNFYTLPVPMRIGPTFILGTPIENTNVSNLQTTVFTSRTIRLWGQATASGQCYWDGPFTASAEL